MENKAKITIQLDRERGKVDPKIFGHFTEHAFGNIYGGIYDPQSPLADEDGQRKDVLELLRKVKTPLLRYPGGNFVSNYHWEDGIGPKENRKRVFEYAWATEESNQFGTVDFILECRKIGAEPYLCVNMGSGTVEEAMHWVEYCNGRGNTYYANLRRSHGYEEPFGVKYWGLGNEMYGDWQMEKLDAKAYAVRALEFAKAMKWADPSISLVICGMQEDCDWNSEAVKKLHGMADYISAHHYAVGWGPFQRDNYLENLYIPQYMEKVNEMVKASIVVGQNDAGGHIKVAWDEWNLFGWLVDGVNDDKSYTLQNALVTASILNFFIRNCESVGMANYSTFVNLNGALSVKEDCVLRRPQYYAFELLAGNTGDVLADTYVRCGSYVTEVPGNARRRKAPRTDSLIRSATEENQAEIPYLDAVATTNGEGEIFLSLINKHLEEDLEVEIEFFGDSFPAGEAQVYSIGHEDVWAYNTLENPDNVVLKTLPSVPAGKTMRFVAQKHSVNLIKMKKA